jgi:hypothetical protein
MNHLSTTIVTISMLSLLGCGAEDKDDSVVENDGVLPQAGDWNIITTGWANDDCNAAEGLTPATSITIANVDSSSFTLTFYENDFRIGETSTCTFEGDEQYLCTGFTNSFSYTDADATISMSGDAVVTITSETAASGSGDLTMECTGADCSDVATWTTSGSFPCGTTMNWTAEAQ